MTLNLFKTFSKDFWNPETQKILMQLCNRSSIKKIFDALDTSNKKSLIVGGAVRDALLKKEPLDVDIATELLPFEIIAILKKHHIDFITIGIDFGTITAIIDHEKVEITSLRQDHNHDGRHADVSFHDNWYDDAIRRDFTINALYLDRHCNVYDATDGTNDLLEKKLHFVGDVQKRVEEDYLRILRYWRFLALLGFKDDEQTIEIINALSHHIKRLSFERITKEFFKTLLTDHAFNILEKAKNSYQAFWANFTVPQNLKRLIERENKLGEKSLLRRLFYFDLSSSPIKLSNDQKKHLKNLDACIHNQTCFDNLPAQLFLFGKNIVRDACILSNDGSWNDVLLQIENMPVPIFPLNGFDIKELGVESGKKLGELLEQTKTWWLAQKCTPTRLECFDFIKKFKD